MSADDGHDIQELLTIVEIAEWFRHATKTVREWVVSGRLPTVRTPGGQYRVLRSDLDEVMTRLNGDLWTDYAAGRERPRQQSSLLPS